MSLVGIDRNGGVALYSQIARLMEEEIQCFYKAGECIPSENEWAERFSVNRHTVRRAVDELLIRGLLERRQGKGTFVLDARLDYMVASDTRFTETLEALGKSTASKIIRKLIVPARAGVATRLGLSEDDPVLWIETLRLADNRPLCVISHFLPQESLGAVYANYRGGSLHEFILHTYGITLKRIESEITATLAQGDDASLLAMPQNHPVLRVKSINVNEADAVPFEYALTRFRADRTQLRIHP